MLFDNRKVAGEELAEILSDYKGENLYIFGLARGGVIVANEIAKNFNAPLDVLTVRKIGMPGYPELGIGAIAPGGIKILNKELIEKAKIPPEVIEDLIKEEQKELERRVKLYRGNLELPKLNGKKVIIVDDGVATGITAEASVEVVKRQNPEKIIFAAPVCAPEASIQLGPQVDDFRCLYTPYDFIAVGQYFREFDQVTDEEIIKILRHAKRTS